MVKTHLRPRICIASVLSIFPLKPPRTHFSAPAALLRINVLPTSAAVMAPTPRKIGVDIAG